MADQPVAVLGAGSTMGFPMARNIARAGIAVRGWNRTKDKAEPLVRDGAQVCERPSEATEGAAVILTMLADADAVIDSIEDSLSDFEPLFRLELAAKDAGLVEEAAKRHQLDLPLFAAVRERMAQGTGEHGDKDMSATWFTSAPAGATA